MTKSDIELKYKSLLEDRDFEELEFLLKQPNIFQALGIEKYELRHSSFLAWLLDPIGSHNLGAIFLNRFLREILMDPRSKELSIIDLPDFQLEKATVKREWKNIDILIELPEILVVIENKIQSSEHSDQLSIYKKRIEGLFLRKKIIFVYLTPFGFASSLNETYINLSYESITSILFDIVNNLKGSINPSTFIYITDYINTVKKTIMENSEINVLARKIYLNHRELMEEIIANKPDEASEFKQILEKKIEEKGWILRSTNRGYVRFLTPKLNNIIPMGYGKGWPLKEAFLFEICFLYTGKNQVRVYATIDASDSEAAVILKPIFDEIEGKTNKSTLWLSYKNHYHKVDFSSLVRNETKEIIDSNIDAIIKLAEKVVNEVEEKVLSAALQLTELINSRIK